MAERPDLPQKLFSSKRPRVSALLYDRLLFYRLLRPGQLSDERHSSHPSRPVYPVLTDDEPSSDSDSDTEPDLPSG